MFDWLFDSFEQIGVGVINGVVYALGTVIAGLLFLLPEMPTLPVMPDPFTTAAGWVAWVFPVDTLLLVLAFVLSMWLLWQGIALALRWAKAIGS